MSANAGTSQVEPARKNCGNSQPNFINILCTFYCITILSFWIRLLQQLWQYRRQYLRCASNQQGKVFEAFDTWRWPGENGEASTLTQSDLKGNMNGHYQNAMSWCGPAHSHCCSHPKWSSVVSSDTFLRKLKVVMAPWSVDNWWFQSVEQTEVGELYALWMCLQSKIWGRRPWGQRRIQRHGLINNPWSSMSGQLRQSQLLWYVLKAAVLVSYQTIITKIALISTCNWKTHFLNILLP